MNAQTPTLEAVAISAGAVSIGGQIYMTDAMGSHVPIEAVRAQDRLQDEIVRKVVGYAQPLAAEIARFRAHTFDDVDSFVALMEQQYKARGGAKGNLTLTSFDGTLKVQVAVASIFSYGAELQAAKSLVDECLQEWSADTRAEIRAIIQNAFRVDQEGNVSRTALLALLKLDFGDERWVRAMAAIRDAEKVIGSKRYVRIYSRPKATDGWTMVSLDLAS